MDRGNTRLLRAAASAVLAAGALAACDAPMDPAASAVAGGPSLLITPACAGTGGQAHGTETIITAVTWTRASSPHRVSGSITIQGAGRLTIAPGAVVCAEPAGRFIVQSGGRLNARGRDTALVVLTARDPALGWGGMAFSGTPAGPSYLTNVRVEHVRPGTAILASGQHPVYVDSAVIRQNARAVVLQSPGSRLSRSVVDSTTDRMFPAVSLEAGTRLEQTVVRGSAQVGVQAYGDVLLMGGRIEGSRGTGLQAWGGAPNPWSTAIRVVGNGSYGAELGVEALATLYPTPALQDSLLGNAVDSVRVMGGILRRSLTVGPQLPLWAYGMVVDSGGALIAGPGASFTFEARNGIQVRNGGRIAARGSAASPVLFTADDPARGWGGIMMIEGGVSNNYLTNTRLEHVSLDRAAIVANGGNRVIVDSSVIRQAGRAADLGTANSRMSRTRVDTTLDSSAPAVRLGVNARLESTLIRAPAGPGVEIMSSTVQVAGCEIRDGDQDGIVMNTGGIVVRNCNLVNNAGVGIRNISGGTSDAAGNWWGSTGGPLGAGGAGVEGLVVYSPWRTTPYALPYVP